MSYPEVQAPVQGYTQLHQPEAPEPSSYSAQLQHQSTISSSPLISASRVQHVHEHEHAAALLQNRLVHAPVLKQSNVYAYIPCPTASSQVKPRPPSSCRSPASTKHAILPSPKAEASRRRSVRACMHAYVRTQMPGLSRNAT
jgi:hypothetical protein